MQIKVIFLFFFGFLTVSQLPLPETKAELGEKLFFDPILSRDSSISCASCHKPHLAFADSLAVSPGIEGRLGRRNAPSVMNMAFRSVFFYDGRAKTIRDQIHFPIQDSVEMDLSYEVAVSRLISNKYYKTAFNLIYKEDPNVDNVADAISEYESTLETANTEFDAWMNNRPNAMSASAIRGRDVFMSDKAKCFNCHFGPDFTDDDFKNIGLYDDSKYTDRGRYDITKKPSDMGKFKVPGLRNVAVTAPYMHDGSFKTLREVIEYYDNPYKIVHDPINIDEDLSKPLNLTEQEKRDLEAFLRSLTDRRFYQMN